ncbi:hypothetical protein DL93DRAFT_2112903 [Clavulina sp. PMI_390]|nr:hypothetical protein DL93DRAFT_2112903 [Clavulina sp. PMI_390]
MSRLLVSQRCFLNNATQGSRTLASSHAVTLGAPASARHSLSFLHPNVSFRRLDRCSSQLKSPSRTLSTSSRSLLQSQSPFRPSLPSLSSKPSDASSSSPTDSKSSSKDLEEAPRILTPSTPTSTPTVRENIYTIPNALTVSRILACPVLGYSIIQGDFALATGILAYAGITDWVDGFIARRFNMKTVLGTILDPAADKALMTTLTVTLAVKGLLPVPLAVIILGRDVLLSLSAFYIRYKSLPAPKTWSRYWDFGIPSAEVRPTEISKINTALQLLLMACTTVSPLIDADLHVGLQIFQWVVAGTTIWSGMGYLFSRDAVRYVARSAGSAGKKQS